MLCPSSPTGPARILSRVRSHKKLRSEGQQSLHQHQRQTSVSSSGSRPSTDSDAYRQSHFPSVEWDPLRLNPVPQVPAVPSRQHDSFRERTERTLREKRSFAGHELHRPRNYQSPRSEIYDGFDFGFGGENPVQNTPDRHHDEHHLRDWPSPTSSAGSEWDVEDDGDVKRDPWESPSPRRRPQAGTLDGPDYFIKRGGWKRRGIIFGGHSEEVYLKEDDAFDLP